MGSHCAELAGNLEPHSIDLIIESFECVCLQLYLLIVEKGENAGRRDETGHCGRRRDVDGAT
jgi:hypothetical protein